MFGPGNGNAIAAGVGAGMGMIAAAGAIASVLQARRMLREMEQRMADWENPGRQYAPMRREFDLHNLNELGTYVFDLLVPDIVSLREINCDLHSLRDDPAAAYHGLLVRMQSASDALLNDDMNAAEVFEGVLDKELNLPPPFDPKTHPLHQDINHLLTIMRRQYDAVIRDKRGAVFGGSYEVRSSARTASVAGMRHEFERAKCDLEKLRNQLVDENIRLADEIEYLRSALPGAAGLYEQAVEAFVGPDQEVAARAAKNFVETIRQSQNGDVEGAIRRYGTQINLAKQ